MYLLTAHSCVKVQLITDLIGFILGTQLSTCVLLAFMILNNKFKHNWLATATDIWNSLSDNMVLQDI